MKSKNKPSIEYKTVSWTETKRYPNGYIRYFTMKSLILAQDER